MPRIRTIKPDHWNDKNLPLISMQAHLLWLGIWNFSDDEGIFEGDALLLKSNIFPRRKDIRTEQINQWLDQLVNARFIIPFEFENVGYYITRTFNTHQRIDKPQQSKIPKEFIKNLLVNSNTVLGSIPLYSTVEDSNVKVNGNASASPPPTKISTKKNKEPEPYWQQLIAEWFNFYKEKFNGEEPTFVSRTTTDFKQLIECLKKRSVKKKWEWTEDNAVKGLRMFLEMAVKDNWLSKNLTIANLVKQFDSVFQKSYEAKNPVRTGTSISTGPKSFTETINYIIGRYLEGELDERILLPEYYDKLVTHNMLQVGTMAKYAADTIDQQKILAVKGFLESKSKKLVNLQQ